MIFDRVRLVARWRGYRCADRRPVPSSAARLTGTLPAILFLPRAFVFLRRTADKGFGQLIFLALAELARAFNLYTEIIACRREIDGWLARFARAHW